MHALICIPALIFITFYLFCVVVGMDACVTAFMWRSEDNFRGSVLSSHSMGLGKQTQVTGLPASPSLTESSAHLLPYTSYIYLK